MHRQANALRRFAACLAVTGLAIAVLLWAPRALGEPDAPAPPPVAAGPAPSPPVGSAPPDATAPQPATREREPAGTDDIDVRVVHAATNQPIAGAKVHAEWRSSFATGRGATLSTDATGTVRLRPEPGVTTLVHASAEGFLPATVPLAAEMVTGEVLVRLTPETVTQVKVIDAATRTPIAGARVFAVPPLRVARIRPPGSRVPEPKVQNAIHCTSPAGVTDTTGLATLRGVGSGFHTVLALADGFLPGRCDDVELPPQPTPLEIALTPGHPIEIVAHDEDGQPLGDREVTVVDLLGDAAFLLRTDERGRATSPGYPAGCTVRVQVARPDLSAAAQFLETIQGIGQRNVVVPVAEPVRIVVPAQRGRAIDCVWDPGAPGDRLHLKLFGRHGAEAHIVDWSEVATERGRWQSGCCTIGEPFFEAIGTRSGIWRSEAAVPQPGGIPCAVLTERVPRDATLTVICSTADGVPVPDAVVTLGALATDLGMSTQVLPSEADSAGGGPTANYISLGRARSDAAGRVHFPALLPGRHTIAAQHARDGAGTAVMTVAGATTQTIVLAPTGTVRGRVSGRPPGVPVTVVIQALGSPWRRSVAVAEDGVFTTALAAGPYELGAQLADISLDGARLLAVTSARQRIEVSAGHTATCDLTLPVSVRRVEVSTAGVDPAGHEVLAERVHPYDRVGSSRWVTRRPIGRDGVARFERLEADAAFGLLLVRRSDGRVLAQLDLERHVQGRVELRLPPRAMLTVQAVVVPAADVRLAPLHAHGTLLREAMMAPDVIDGSTARFRDVPAGRYRLVTIDTVGRVRGERRPDVDVGASGLAVEWR